jgi:hypothetical protein
MSGVGHLKKCPARGLFRTGLAGGIIKKDAHESVNGMVAPGQLVATGIFNLGGRNGHPAGELSRRAD